MRLEFPYLVPILSAIVRFPVSTHFIKDFNKSINFEIVEKNMTYLFYNNI